MNVKNGLIQDVDLGVERHEQALALTKFLANEKLHQVNWQDYTSSIIIDKEWVNEVSFLARNLPRMKSRT
jgi:hypothetical protein